MTDKKHSPEPWQKQVLENYPSIYIFDKDRNFVMCINNSLANSIDKMLICVNAHAALEEESAKLLKALEDLCEIAFSIDLRLDIEDEQSDDGVYVCAAIHQDLKDRIDSAKTAIDKAT